MFYEMIMMILGGVCVLRAGGQQLPIRQADRNHQQIQEVILEVRSGHTLPWHFQVAIRDRLVHLRSEMRSEVQMS